MGFPEQCLCGTVTITGIACDDDGDYDRDRLEVRRVHPDPDDAWQLAREYANSPVCSAAPLYT